MNPSFSANTKSLTALDDFGEVHRSRADVLRLTGRGVVPVFRNVTEALPKAEDTFAHHHF